MQREAPAAQLPTLFDQHPELRQAFTLKFTGDESMNPGECANAVLNSDCGGHFVVTNCEGKVIGVINGESGRVIAEKFQPNQLTTVKVRVAEINPTSGDARVHLIAE